MSFDIRALADLLHANEGGSDSEDEAAGKKVCNFQNQIMNRLFLTARAI